MSKRPSAKIFSGTPRNISRLARALIGGDVVAVPTETVYGLAGDALNPRAVQKIFRAKGRPANDPLIVHIHSLAQLDTIAERNSAVEKLAAAFWPGPLTLVLPKKDVVPDLVTSGRPTVAVRMPKHPLLRSLLRACGCPLAAPSANPFGYVSPTTAAHVHDGLGTKIRYILDGGTSTIGLESTIVDLSNPRRPVLLRPGAIAASEIEQVLGVRVSRPAKKTVSSNTAAPAPGMLARHYSPRTPIELHARLSSRELSAAEPRQAFLFFNRPAKTVVAGARNVFWLTERGNVERAAKALFATLRLLDRGAWTMIHAERAPEGSALALAINDRLSRAAARR